jgi:hypothetical protein
MLDTNEFFDITEKIYIAKAKNKPSTKLYYQMGLTCANLGIINSYRDRLLKLKIRSSEPKLKKDRNNTYDIKIKMTDFVRSGLGFREERKQQKLNEYKRDFGNLQRLDGPALYERREFNSVFFSKWNREMAYVLGLIYADGWLFETNSGGKQVGLASKDKELLEMINSLLDSNANINQCKKDESVWYEIRIGSKELYSDLTKLGLHQNKSLSMLFPKIPDMYLWDFIRGYFDGDGCICQEKGGDIIILFTSGSKIFLEELNIKLDNIFHLYKKSDSDTTYDLKGYKKIAKIMFLKMYHNTQTYLKRKYNKFVEIFHDDEDIVRSMQRCIEIPRNEESIV